MNKKTLKDVQSEPDPRKIGIDKVGVKGIRYPVVVLDKKKKIQHTVASINMYVRPAPPVQGHSHEPLRGDP